MSDITGFKGMNPKRYPLHHDHGTVTISRDVFETMSKELERLRPMETGLELAEADRDSYRKRVDDLKKAQRWRKFSEEKPEKGQKVLFRAKYKTDNIRTWIGEFRNVGFDVFYASAPGWGCEFLPNEIFGWMPLPNPPEDITR